MEVRKESNGLKNSMVTREELAIINQFTKRALKEDEVYTFAVRLCDNEVDRDGERFPRATLEELAELFVGKSGIFDHEWTAKGQAARIYRTEIVEEEGVCSQGEGRCYLKGYPRQGRGQRHGGKVFPHERIVRAVPGVRLPRGAPGYGKRHPARHHCDRDEF